MMGHLGEITCSLFVLSGGPGLHRVPLDQSLDAFLEEAHMVMFDCVDKVLRNAGVSPAEVRKWKDAVIILCLHLLIFMFPLLLLRGCECGVVSSATFASMLRD
jgi:hypothetical protein